MDEMYPIQYFEQPDEAMWKAIGGGIRGYNTQQAGEDHYNHLCFMVYGAEGEIVGGLIGSTYWDWLYINLLWLREDMRGRGLGQRLLSMAEEEGRRRGAKNAYLDTFSFQAPDFYHKYGYQVFGELQDFPKGHRRFFLTKAL